jgi:hypothetical protein
MNKEKNKLSEQKLKVSITSTRLFPTQLNAGREGENKG